MVISWLSLSLVDMAARPCAADAVCQLGSVRCFIRLIMQDAVPATSASAGRHCVVLYAATILSLA